MKLSDACFQDGIVRLAAAFGRKLTEKVTEAFYFALSGRMDDETFRLAVTRWIEDGERFPVPAQLLRFSNIQAKRHSCIRCEKTPGWIHLEEGGTSVVDGQPRHEHGTMQPCPGRSDKRAREYWRGSKAQPSGSEGAP